MDKVVVAFWSGTGNTQEMANAIGEGVTAAGKEVEVVDIGSISPSDLKDLKGFALGCPSMGAEVLEEDSMEPFVEELEQFISGKQIGLFGSYGWGDCEWMRDWEERMKNAGAILMEDEGITVLGEPDDNTKDQCRELGKTLASL